MANKYEIVRYYSEKENCTFLEVRKNGQYVTVYRDTEEGLNEAIEYCNILAGKTKKEVIYSITD